MAKAQVGDLIRIVDAHSWLGGYKIGDIFEVTGRWENGVFINLDTKYNDIYDTEYVIHRKAGEEDSEPIDYKGASVLFAPGEAILSKEGAEKLLKQDAVNSPNHYTQGRFETIEVIEHLTTKYDDGFVAHCVGTAFKYMDRAPYKHDNPTECLRKAAKYLSFAIEHLDAKIRK